MSDDHGVGDDAYHLDGLHREVFVLVEVALVSLLVAVGDHILLVIVVEHDDHGADDVLHGAVSELVVNHLFMLMTSLVFPIMVVGFSMMRV